MNKRSISLALFAVVAQSFANLSHPLWAGSSDPLVRSAKAVLQAKLLEPLQEKEDKRSRFSRAVLPPQARRIRILDSVRRTDAQGRKFLSFAIDETRGLGGGKEIADAHWLKDAITGCVYPDTGKVMVRRGDVYYSSSILLGQRTPIAPSGVCTAN